jgi:universal stress protein E
MNLRQLLVVIDPTQDNQPALQRAAWLARQTGAALELLLCEYHSALDGGLLLQGLTPEKARAALLDQRRQWLETLAEPLRREGLDLHLEVRWGKPLHKVIMARAEELKPDLLFKSARNHGLLKRLFLTNTCWHLVRHCQAPLWLVHHGEWQGHRLCAALDPLHSADKPASLDHRLISATRELADKLGMEDHYLHSYAPLPRTLVFDAELVAAYDQYAERCAEQHRTAFEELLSQYPIPLPSTHLLEGFAEEVIPRFVREEGIDLLLMGAIARGHLDNALIGNTAERVLEAVDCDLLVLKPNGNA